MTQPANPPANGPVAAAVLSCGVGCLLLGGLAIAADGSKNLATLLDAHARAFPDDARQL